MTESLSGRVVIITGASSGIGAAAARELVHQGCKVSLAARSEQKLRALAGELGEAALALPTDTTSAADVDLMVQRTLERFGRVDVLFANAGIYIPGQFAEGRIEELAGLVDVNVNGVLRCIHAVLPAMTAQHEGDVVITSSISGHVDIPWEPVYSATKHAVQALAHTLRRQLAPHGIRVGSVAPGMVANELWKITSDAEVQRHVRDRTAVTSEDVVDALVFMLSRPRHVTIRDLVLIAQNQDL